MGKAIMKGPRPNAFTEEEIRRLAKKALKGAAIEQAVKEMEESGELHRLGKMLAMAHQLFSIGNAMVEEVHGVVESRGLNYGKLKTLSNNMMQSFDAYDKVFAAMLHGDGEAWAQVCEDNELLTEVVDALMKNNVEVVRGPYFGAKLFLPEKQR